MYKNKQKTIDATGIVALFGGKHQIVEDYAKILRTALTIKAVEKWGERQAIPMTQLMNLKTIAQTKGMTFNIDDFISGAKVKCKNPTPAPSPQT